MNGKWLAERILNGPFRGLETKEMELMRVPPQSVPAPAVGDSNPKRPESPSSNGNGNGGGGGGSLSLKQFVDRFSLPRIVRIVPEEPIAAAAECSDPAALLNCTLLLYKQYRSGKIEAKKFVDARNTRLVESGGPDIASTIVIPDTYQGWFSVMTERGQVKARQYSTVQRLIAAQVTAFLIVGHDLIGYYQNHPKTNTDAGARSRSQYVKTVIRSGQILKLLAVYEDIAEQSTRSKRLSWPLLGSKHQSTQYAQCMTVKKQIVYVPITTHGYFYAVSTANNTADDNVSKVYQIAKLLQVFPLPVRVCSIYPQKINGSILLETYRKEDVLLACVVDDKQSCSSGKCRFLEIDVNSKFAVNLVADEHRLFKKTRVQKALRSCHADSDKWCQQLKVIHHIYPSRAQRARHRGDGPDCDKDKAAARRGRKLSLGDKKTVKSASFRFSTSYGVDDLKPLYRNLPPTEPAAAAASAAATKSTGHPPPVYLDVALHPNEENGCSSLPTQKSDRTAFENESPLQLALRNRNAGGARPEPASSMAVAEQRRPEAARPSVVAKRLAGSCSSSSSYHKLLGGRNDFVVTDRSVSGSHSSSIAGGASKARVTKIVDIERLINGKVRRDHEHQGRQQQCQNQHQQHHHQQQQQQQCQSQQQRQQQCQSQQQRQQQQQQQQQLQRSHEQDQRYRVIKKENGCVSRDSWSGEAAGQPLLYKTQVVVRIDDSYSDAMDAIRSSRVHRRVVHHRHDDIYAEIDEFGGTDAAAGYVIFPQTKSCFVGDSCSSSYMRLPASSAVNVS